MLNQLKARLVRLTEVWRPVVGFEDCYAVSNHGRVKRTKSGGRSKPGFILKNNTIEDGYQYVILKDKPKCKSCYIHRLVLEAFVGPCPPGHECNHKDGRKDKNYLWNLEWITPSENQIHRRDVLQFGCKKWMVTYPSGKKRFVTNLENFCEERNLSSGNMSRVSRGHRKHHKGWSCHEISSCITS